jgi:hypothetical protein
LTAGLSQEPLPESETVSLTRAKVEPMVRGLFPKVEQDLVLAMLERSVIFVTCANIESLLLECSFDGSAWTLANLYVASVGAELLGKTAPHLVGLSEETTCYVSPKYFLSRDEPFDDFVVHEAAHIFHNCKLPPSASVRLEGKSGCSTSSTGSWRHFILMRSVRACDRAREKPC